MTPVTVCGNLTGDPELRFTGSGTAVATFSLAVNRRKLGEDGKTWEDADADFVRCVVWRDMAENVANSFGKGQRLIVTGDLRQRSWETDEGDKRSTFEVNASEVGASVRWAICAVTKVNRRRPDEPPASAYDPSEEPF
jgi:single-strand DNA-binding protein